MKLHPEATKRLLFAMLSVAAMPLLASAQTADIFTPSHTTSLRMPAVPLLVSDPYFSIWSPSDELYAETTMHWSSANKSVVGVLRVDGKPYRFLGKKEDIGIAIAPTAREKGNGWECKYLSKAPAGEWTAPHFDDSSWKSGQGAFGDRGSGEIKTRWEGTGTDLYIRRTFSLPTIDKGARYIIRYSHDDVFELYVNGEKLIDTGNTWLDDQTLELTPEQAARCLREGNNVIAAHCHNTTGGSYADFGIYYIPADGSGFQNAAQQLSVSVLATSSFYTFKCGPVKLQLVFTAPQIIDDLDLLSTPINYVSYKVTALDSKKHDVELLLLSSPRMAVNEYSQPTISRKLTVGDATYVRAGTIDQPYCERKGDRICQDWGYFYLTASGPSQAVTLASETDVEKQFAGAGTLPAGSDEIRCYDVQGIPALAFADKLGTVDKKSPAQGFTMVGYDDVWSIEYLHELHKAYWTHGGKVSITDAFSRLRRDYASIMQRCRSLDERIYSDALKAGGREYAEILSGAYRQVISAHKLFADNEGRLLWFSKENNSNGCVNTVDLTYPSAPLFLLYNPALQKGMMTSIFESSLSGRWHKPFAQHDMGTYPQANGQIYGGDMPLEESGNMLILAAELCRIDGNTDYVKPYWSMLKTWADYLADNGQDPANQLCTDDFAGHWAHNANLSAKAIMGVAAYALMLKQDGRAEESEKYMNNAREMAAVWEKTAADGDHYRLAFDRPNTWSQKYNIVWDKLWGTHIFSPEVMKKEIAYYLTKQNVYGLPLDCRKDYTKSDWIMWSAAMADDDATFQKFILPIYKFYDETTTRVPMSDWFETKKPVWVSFRARSVIGGFWMKVLMGK